MLRYAGVFAMHWIVLLPLLVQSAAMFFDEFYYHVRRGLPRWERIGHPLDTLTVLACLAWVFFMPPTSANAIVYVGLSLFSSVFVLKDERVHFDNCALGEQWLHALLFVIHPVVLLALAAMWRPSHGASALADWLAGALEARQVLVVQGVGTVVLLAYQVIYWNLVRRAGSLSEAKRDPAVEA